MHHLSARFVWLACVLLLATRAQAHHSFAIFDQDKTIEIRGVIVDFKLRNPHSSFVVDGIAFIDGVPQSTGAVRWEIESDTTASLRASGVDADTFKPGDRATLRAWPNREPTFRFAHATSLTTVSGAEFRFGFAGNPRSFSPSLRQAGGGGGPPPAAAPAARGAARISGRWQQPITPRGDTSPLPLNDAGAAARAAFDRKRSPANTCEPMSLPDIYDAPFFLVDLRVEERRVVWKHELYDLVRTIPLDQEAAPAAPGSVLGRVHGRLEGDALVVESSGYPASGWGLGIATHVLGGGADVPSSEQKAVTERYSVSADGQTLVLAYTVSDPVYLREPYSGRVELTRVPEGTAIYPYECDLEAARMWSRTESDEALRVGR